MVLQGNYMTRSVIVFLISLFLCISCSRTPIAGTDWYPVSVKKLPESTKVHTDTNSIGKPIYWIKYRGNKIYLTEANKILIDNHVEHLYVIKNKHVVKNVTTYSIIPSSKLSKSDEVK